MSEQPKIIKVTNNGVTVSEMNNQTHVAITKRIKFVTIENIIDLAKCGMSINNGVTMQYFEFRNGGTAEVTFDANGKFEVFQTTEGVYTKVVDGEIVVLSMLKSQ